MKQVKHTQPSQARFTGLMLFVVLPITVFVAVVVIPVMLFIGSREALR